LKSASIETIFQFVYEPTDCVIAISFLQNYK
jgi:hypothetical protein